MRDLLLRLSLLLMIITLTAACGGGAAPTEAPPVDVEPTAGMEQPPAETSTEAVVEPPADTGYTGGEVADGGSISGRIVWTGEVPEAEVYTPEGDDEKAECGESIEVMEVDVADDTAVADAIVWIKEITAGKPNEAGPATLDQSACEYVPGALWVTAGSSVQVTNSDPFSHNVNFGSMDNPPLNELQPADSEPLEYVTSTPEVINIACDIHDWMMATLVVSSHPYHSVTGEDGLWELADVPAGDYTVGITVNGETVKEVDVTVEAGGDTDLGDWDVSG